MRLFCQYCKDTARVRFSAVFLFLMIAVWWLQDLPWQPMLYMVFIASVSALIFAGLDFFRYRKRYQWINELKLQAEQGILSPPQRKGSGIDADWLALMCLWHQKCLDEKERGQTEKKKNNRYYTLWSHQIKTPLAAMNLLLQEETLDRQAMEQELLKAEQYVDMALQYQRLDRSGRDLVLNEYKLDALIKKLVKQMAPVFIYNKTRIRLESLDRMVLTDEKWFLFVLEQILGNAVKYAPKGEIHIYLTASGNELVVEDNGIGIRAQDINRVFEWGYTGCNGRQEKRSTGIGLFLCRQAVEMLGQTIRIESEEGTGARVYVGIARDRFSIE